MGKYSQQECLVGSVSSIKECPKCKHDFSYRKKMPDICTNCFFQINTTPLSDVYGVPDYIGFQFSENNDTAQNVAAPLPSEGEIEEVSTKDVVLALQSEVSLELNNFLTTCSISTVSMAMLDAELFAKHALYNSKLEIQDLKSVAAMCENISTFGKQIENHLKIGGISLYELRKQTAAASKLGQGNRSPVDLNKEGS